MNIIAFVDHEIGYTLLNKIIGLKHLNLLAVVTTQNNSNKWWPSVKPICEKHNIPLMIYPIDEKEIKKYGPVDAMFLISWKHILHYSLLDIPRIGTVNLHYSLLPKYRGVYPVNRAIMNGDSESGVTYHFVNHQIDAGLVICQKPIEINPEDTARSLQIKLDSIAEEQFLIMLERLEKSPQQKGGSFPINKDDFMSLQDYQKTNELNPNVKLTAMQMVNLLRGKTFFPEAPQLFYIDPISGEKVYLTVHLSKNKGKGH
jgi:methionyl-tRNA formyltransferase